MKKTPAFFLGAGTPQGYVSFYDELYEDTGSDNVFIIRGGPGTAPARFLSKAADALSDQEGFFESIRCSCRSERLDAVILRSDRQDGKSVAAACDWGPHRPEARYPGAVSRSVNLESFWNNGILFANRDSIVELTNRSQTLTERSSRFMAAAGSLLHDTYRIALECTDELKVKNHAMKLAEREMPCKKGCFGRERRRFLSAVTDRGIVLMRETPELLCDKIYNIKDEYGAVSRLFMQTVKECALGAGYDCFVCCCPLSPFEKIDHVLIPELRLGFLSAGKFLQFDCEMFRNIHSQRFELHCAFSEKKQRIAFNKKAVAVLLEEASKVLIERKETEDRLSEIYDRATDMAAFENFTEDFWKNWNGR